MLFVINSGGSADEAAFWSATVTVAAGCIWSGLGKSEIDRRRHRCHGKDAKKAGIVAIQNLHVVVLKERKLSLGFDGDYPAITYQSIVSCRLDIGLIHRIQIVVRRNDSVACSVQVDLVEVARAGNNVIRGECK